MTRPRAWLAVAALAVAIAALLVWGFVGSIPQTVSADGVVSGPSGVTVVESPRSGEVVSVPVEIGDRVRERDPIATVVGADGKRHLIRSRLAGTVLQVETAPGRVIDPGAHLLTLDPPRALGRGLVAVLFLDPQEAATVVPGMAVTLSTLSSGNLSGRVTEVDNALASEEALENVVGNDLLVRQLAAELPVLVEVTVRGTSDPRLTSGALVNGTITLRDRRPIDVVFG